MSDKFKYDTVPLPLTEDLSDLQKPILQEYCASHEQLEQEPQNAAFKKASLMLLAKFYGEFPPEIKRKYKHWYQYQISFIDPLMGACAQMSKMLNESGIPERAAVSADGNDFLIPLDGKAKETKDFLERVKREMPGLEFNIIENE